MCKDIIAKRFLKEDELIQATILKVCHYANTNNHMILFGQDLDEAEYVEYIMCKGKTTFKEVCEWAKNYIANNKIDTDALRFDEIRTLA